MIQLAKNVYQYRELVVVLAGRDITVRYRQAYLGATWVLLRPALFTLVFTLVRSFVGIDSGNLPYPVLIFAALLPWTLCQDAATEGVASVVANASLVRKVYFPREVFPLTAVATKTVDLAISGLILAGLMLWYEIAPTVQILWAPLIILYTLVVALTIAFFGAAINVYYRDAGSALPVLLSLMMYASPVIYPLTLVREALLVGQAAGDWSKLLYIVYTANPLSGIIDAFQRVVLRGMAPDFSALLPGLAVTLILFPLSYRFFKRTEAGFADII